MSMLRATPEARSYPFVTQAAFFVLLLTIALLGVGRASASTTPAITVDGHPNATSALEHANVVFVPAVGVFNKLGTTVKTSAKTLVATKGGREIGRFAIGSRTAVIDGATHTLGAAPFLAGGAAMLPLRAISEAAGASVTYASSPRSIAITSKHAVAAVAPAAAAVVAQSAAPAATDAAAAPVAATQDNGGIPWWVWLLLALLVLALLLWLLSRRKKDPVITTSSRGRGDEPVIKTRK